MSQSAPGWYQDHDDPRLARWWDGERWTEHTLVLDEQDWSTEPAPPQTGTRFPTPSTGEVPVVESVPEAGFEEDIYAPIRDPWGEDEVAEDPATTAWSSPDEVWGAGGTAAIAASAAWDDGGTDTSWATDDGRRRTGAGGVAGWPTWAKVALPLGVLALVLLLASVTGALGGDDDKATTTTSSTSTSVVSLGDAAQTALRTAGNGPFTLSTFTTLIPLTCDAAANNTPANLTDRIVLLGYDAETVTKLVTGLAAGTDEYCPNDIAKSPGLLSQVQAAVGGGATTSSTTTPITLPTDGTTTTTKKKTTVTTKKPATTSTTKAPVTTPPPTTPPTTPPTSPPSTDPPPTTPSTEAPPTST